ncbi:MAG TPA: hypothetical protein VGH28_14990 [Polyangiaceae bacterium]|jgi:hypothetical protein
MTIFSRVCALPSAPAAIGFRKIAMSAERIAIGRALVRVGCAATRVLTCAIAIALLLSACGKKSETAGEAGAGRSTTDDCKLESRTLSGFVDLEG